ncbi:MAG: M48 family metallopeptidase [Acidovorax sp.]|nr:M48 family metallopeptidase [Acidovorax sp.]
MPHWVQRVLDWFDPPAAQAGTAAAPQPAPPPLAAAPQAPVPPRSRRIAAPAAEPLDTLLSPAVFRHPQASREVLLGGARVAYQLQRARRRSIGFTVGPEGLSVRAPGWVTLAAVDAALQEKSGWILRKLGEADERRRRQASARIRWADGAQLPYLGEPLTVVLDPAQQRSGRGGALAHGEGGRRELHIGLSSGAAPAQIRDAVQAWLMREARRRFTERLDHFAPLLGVRWNSLRLSSAQTRWGSARSDGAIRLNWRLLHYRQAIIDYVVVHELSHLRVMDHSPRFWDTVARVVPDYAELRNQLRDEPAPQWE